MTGVDQPYFVAMGASGAEGLENIKQLLAALPRSLNAVVMVVLHRPSDQIDHLRDVLAVTSVMPVVVAAEGAVLAPGNCYIGKPDQHLTLIGGNQAHLVEGSDDRLREQTVDTLFGSLAEHAGSRTIGIVLSGAFEDGSRGLAAIHAAHGLTMVLDPKHKPRGMQQNAIDHDGPISFIGTELQIAQIVTQLTVGSDPVLQASYALITLDAIGRITGWTAAASVLFQWTANEIHGRSYTCLFRPDGLDAVLPLATQADLRLSKFDNGERWCVRKDGTRFWANNVVLSAQDDGQADLVVILRDPTQTGVRADTNIGADHDQLQLLVDLIPQLIWRSLDNGDWDWAGPQWVSFTGQSANDSHGSGWLEMVHPDDRAATQHAWGIARSRGGLDVEHRIMRADGEYRWFQTRAVPFPYSSDKNVVRHWFGTSTDVDGIHRAEERIRFLAYHDALTGVANRAQLDQVLNEIVRGEDGGSSYTLLFVDLDRFKLVNDWLGHRGGDEILQQVAARLQHCLSNGDLLARSGGDEFVIVHHPAPHEGITELTARITSAFADGFQVAGQGVSITTSIGVASGVRDGDSADQLMHRADLALYQAKARGSSVCIYDASLEAHHQAQRLLERDLKEALERGAFEVFYQPIMDLQANTVVGYEALARWRHPAQGWVSPEQFIPLAEATGLIVLLGGQIMRIACAAAHSWPNQQRVAVNVSPAQFYRGGLLQMVVDALERTGLPACRLELEVTEGLLMEDSEQIRDTLKALKDLGVRIVLDDFGTGYSSLGYLCRFPFDKVKIDRSFISGMDNDPNSLAIVKAIVALGDSLHLQVTAEGVETHKQLALLRGMNCGQAQGFLLGKPMARATGGQSSPRRTSSPTRRANLEP